MKKILYFFLFATLLGCGVASNLQSSAKGSGWYPVNMKPSQVETDGSVFYSQKLDETEYIEVYYDSSLYEDGSYYYNQLMASYGWTPSGGGIMIASAYASKPSYSALHISVKRGVAIYMYPDTEYRVFRVKRKLY